MRRLAPALAAVLLLLAPAGASGLDYGAHYNGPPEADAAGMALVAEQGSEVVRLPFRWNRIQPEEGGAYDWSEWDAQLALAARHGIRVLANLHGTPDWAASPEPEDGAPHTEAPPTPEHYPHYRAYLEAVVERYGPGGEFWRERPHLRPQPIVEWEIHNEPNLPRFASGGRPDPEEYADLALLSGEAIKSADPNAEVIVGSTASSCERICPEQFLETVFAREGMSAVTDGVAFHVYRPGPRELLRSARGIRRTVDREDSPATPLHLTEFGWGTCKPAEPGASGCLSRRKQASFLAESFRLLAARSDELELATAHWFIEFDLVPCREPATAFCSYGLIDVGAKGQLDRKPSWGAYRAATSDRP